MSLLILLLFFGTVAYAAAPGRKMWVKKFEHFKRKREIPTDIASGPRNTSYVAGTSGRNLALVKYDSSGRVRWKRTYKPRRYRSAEGLDVEVDRWGNVYITGFTRKPGNRHVLIVKYSPAGHRKWAKIYRLNWADEPVFLEVGNRGNFYIAGNKRKKTGGREHVIAKYNRRGQRKWARRIEKDQDNSFYYFSGKSFFMKLDLAENIYITIPKKKNYTTIKYGRGGNRKWVRHFNGAADGFDMPTDMQVDESGNVWVTGMNDQSVGNSPLPSFGVATIKYDTDGHKSWARYYRDEPGVFTMAGPSALDKNGNIFVTAFNSNEYDYYEYDFPRRELIIVKYDANGKKVWLRRNQKAWAGLDWGGSFIARTDSKGAVIITGDCVDEKSWDSNVTTMKYSASGKRKWTKVERSDESDMYERNYGSLSMTIDKKDGIIITGIWDYGSKSVTLKYAP